jgi:hypothetical protein
MDSATLKITSFPVLPKSPPKFRNPNHKILSGFRINGKKISAIFPNGSVSPSASQRVCLSSPKLPTVTIFHAVYHFIILRPCRNFLFLFLFFLIYQN